MVKLLISGLLLSFRSCKASLKSAATSSDDEDMVASNRCSISSEARDISCGCECYVGKGWCKAVCSSSQVEEVDSRGEEQNERTASSLSNTKN